MLVARLARWTRYSAAGVAVVFTGETSAHGKVREASAAGIFYPAESGMLRRQIDDLLAKAARTDRVPGLHAIVCPHAGYVYSGVVAAAAYLQCENRGYSTVIILAPSHTAYLQAASVTDADVFRTPLGDAIISKRARLLARLAPFELEPRCDVRRPPWWEDVHRAAIAPGDDRADTWEHADEVQVPFIQRVMPGAEIIPVIMGDVDPAAAAKALAQVIDDKTLIVVSTDLSHYRSYADARRLDRSCVDAICRLDPSGIGPESACGRIPVLTLIELAKQRGWHARLLDYRNSGDTAGGKGRVVGYAAIAFSDAENEAVATARFSGEERRELLSLARRALTEAASSGKSIEVDPAGMPPALREKKGCFVTLTEGGRLRGCIGHIIAQEPLYQAVADNARSAAIRDPRFGAVTSSEVKDIAIEISVLTTPVPLEFSGPDDLLAKLKPGRDGVVLQIGRRTATYLPQVWEQLRDKVAFLDSLAEKAGCDAGDWRERGVKVSTYQVESFSEADGAPGD